MCCSAFQCVGVRFSVLQCVAVCRGMFQCVVVWAKPTPARAWRQSTPPPLCVCTHALPQHTATLGKTLQHTTHSRASLEAVKYPQSLSPSGSSPSASTISISSHPSLSCAPFPPTLFNPFCPPAPLPAPPPPQLV